MRLINGCPADKLDAQDRGLQYGDGLFETIAFIDDKAPLWERHMARLHHGCRAVAIHAVPRHYAAIDIS